MRYGPYCPKCASGHVVKERSEFGGQDTGDYLCKDCGYAGMRTNDEWLRDQRPSDMNEVAKEIVERATQEDN